MLIKKIFLESIKNLDETQNIYNQGSGLYILYPWFNETTDTHEFVPLKSDGLSVVLTERRCPSNDAQVPPCRVSASPHDSLRGNATKRGARQGRLITTHK